MREYSIPHLRRSGRISIPEDSFDRIREARDLHKEGLGTESVRRQLREDTGELDRSLDMLHRTLESLRGDIKERPATDEVALSPTLRTILARQSLLMSAMFNLTEMVEDLLLATGKPRRSPSEDLMISDALHELEARDRPGIASRTLPVPHAVSAPVHGGVGDPPAVRSTDFGVLRRRRRRVVLAILAALLLVTCLSWAALALVGAGNAGSSVPRVAKTANEPPGGLKAMAGGTTFREAGGAESATGGTESEGRVEVPDVSGRNLEEAVRIISDAGFEVAAIEGLASQGGQEAAIRTEPRAGTSAKAGTPVILTMGGGPAGALPRAQSTSASVTVTASASASAGYRN